MKSGQDGDLARVHRLRAFAKPGQEVGPQALREGPEGRGDAGIREGPRVEMRDRGKGIPEKVVLGRKGASGGSEAGEARDDPQNCGGNPPPQIGVMQHHRGMQLGRPAHTRWWTQPTNPTHPTHGNLFMSGDVSNPAGERELGLGIGVRFLASLVALGRRSDEGSWQGSGKDSVRPLVGQGRGSATSQGYRGR